MKLIFNLSKGEDINSYLEPTVEHEAIRMYLSIRPHKTKTYDIDNNTIFTEHNHGTIDVTLATAQEFIEWLDHAIDSNEYKAESIRNFIRRCFWITYPIEAETYRTSKVSANLMNEWSLIKSRKPYLMTPKEQESFLGETGGINPKGHIRLDGSMDRKI